MKHKNWLLGMLAVLLTFALMFTGCANASDSSSSNSGGGGNGLQGIPGAIEIPVGSSLAPIFNPANKDKVYELTGDGVIQTTATNYIIPQGVTVYVSANRKIVGLMPLVVGGELIVRQWQELTPAAKPATATATTPNALVIGASIDDGSETRIGQASGKVTIEKQGWLTGAAGGDLVVYFAGKDCGTLTSPPTTMLDTAAGTIVQVGFADYTKAAADVGIGTLDGTPGTNQAVGQELVFATGGRVRLDDTGITAGLSAAQILELAAKLDFNTYVTASGNTYAMPNTLTVAKGNELNLTGTITTGIPGFLVRGKLVAGSGATFATTLTSVEVPVGGVLEANGTALDLVETLIVDGKATLTGVGVMTKATQITVNGDLEVGAIDLDSSLVASAGGTATTGAFSAAAITGSGTITAGAIAKNATLIALINSTVGTVKFGNAATMTAPATTILAPHFEIPAGKLRIATGAWQPNYPLTVYGTLRLSERNAPTAATTVVDVAPVDLIKVYGNGEIIVDVFRTLTIAVNSPLHVYNNGKIRLVGNPAFTNGEIILKQGTTATSNVGGGMIELPTGTITGYTLAGHGATGKIDPISRTGSSGQAITFTDYQTIDSDVNIIVTDSAFFGSTNTAVTLPPTAPVGIHLKAAIMTVDGTNAGELHIAGADTGNTFDINTSTRVYGIKP